MIHPHTELRFVNHHIGYGVFATAPIPKGTIVYVKDSLEVEVSNYKFGKLDKPYQEVVEKYSYIDERGVRIISWDHAKYVNHKCDCNSMSSGYGFEVAIKDIDKDEEITDEYGLFNIPVPVDIDCGCADCRKTLLPTDIDNYFQSWDSLVFDAINQVSNVSQPLWNYMDLACKAELMGFLSGQNEYKSVLNLKYTPKKRNRRAAQRQVAQLHLRAA